MTPQVLTGARILVAVVEHEQAAAFSSVHGLPTAAAAGCPDTGPMGQRSADPCASGRPARHGRDGIATCGTRPSSYDGCRLRGIAAYGHAAGRDCASQARPGTLLSPARPPYPRGYDRRRGRYLDCSSVAPAATSSRLPLRPTRGAEQKSERWANLVGELALVLWRQSPWDPLVLLARVGTLLRVDPQRVSHVTGDCRV